MAKEDFNLIKLLSSKIESVEIDSLLSKLLRKILKETGMINQIGSLLDKYVDNTKDTKEKKSSHVRGQLISEKMTFKSFMDFVINLCKVKKVKITITLHHAGKTERVTTHTITATAREEELIPQEELDEILSKNKKTPREVLQEEYEAKRQKGQEAMLIKMHLGKDIDEQ